ncbi:MAG: chondroitin lyase [Mariniphaga sp.]|nr:chondroitin lyase [Mariniphaga sp.]
MKNHICFIIGLLLIAFAAHSQPQSDFQTIKERVVNELMKPKVDDSEISRFIESLNDDGTWPGIDYENVSNEGFEHRYHLGYMVDLARAYKTKSSKYFKKKKVKETIELALKNWVDNDYFCENWWHNEIGTTRGLVTLMMIIGDELDEELVEKAQPVIGRAHLEAPGARPGGDRIKIAGIQAKNMLFLGKDETFNKVVRAIESEIKYSEWVGATYGYGFRYIPSGFSNRKMGGRGIQYDNSFHHRVDGVNNTLSYGLSYAAAFAEWAKYTSGTKFEFSDEKLAQLIDYFLDGICKTAVYGKFPDPSAKNRSISRRGALRPFSASLPEKLLSVSDYRKDEMKEIIDIRKMGIKPTLSHATYYWHSEHFSVQRTDWFASVRLYSTRTHNMEEPYNSEGFLNHHRGDGTNHISVTGNEYADLASVMDYQKIPGTTVMQKPKMPGSEELQKLGLTDFVGAATDGHYGTAAFDFRSPHDPLIARKSWFFFDDEYVCLGAGISCTNRDLNVVTTLNQCLLSNEVTISSANKISIIQKDEKEYENVDWIFQDKVGYIFTKPTTVNIKNNEATGSWWRINKQSDSSKKEIKLNVFKAWINHGKRPSEETYEYIVVPATTLENMEQNKIKQNITILANTPQVQAVKHSEINMCQAVFYKAGEIQVSDKMKLKCETPGIVILQMKSNDKMKVTVSDPNRELGKMMISISAKIEKRGENINAIWNEKEKMSEITIDLPKGHYAGSSVTVIL